jgi:hypothetical protein
MNLKTFAMSAVLASAAVSSIPSILLADETLVLARDGKTPYTLVYAEQATATEKTALEEMRTFLRRVTGAEFPAVAESALAGDAPGIYVGWTRFAARNGIRPSELGEEEWVIRGAGRNLILSGGQPRGTLYAVYEFLEQQVGCHWLARDTEVVPSRPTLGIAAPDVRAKPYVWMRDIYTTYHTMKPTAEMAKRHAEFLTRNKHSITSHQFYGSGTTGSPTDTISSRPPTA